MMKFHLELIPANGHIQPYEIPYGYTFQTVIFGWLHEHNPKLYHKLHTYEEVRPYSINCYIHKDEPKVDFTIVASNQALASTLLEVVIPKKGTAITVARKKYIVEGVDVESIILETMLKQSKPVKRFHLQFATPCYFNTLKGNYPIRFPLPDALFGNLLNIWKAMSASTFTSRKKQFLSWIKAHIYPSSYKMRSASYFIARENQVAGGQGFVSFWINSPDDYYYQHKLKKDTLTAREKTECRQNHFQNSQLIDFLCKVGEYTNVGGHRTAGMGVVRYFPKEYCQPEDSETLAEPLLPIT
ncbi:MAG: CRISPR system precrRNA processing endoribonuclease RAMP protein Cas6 [Promethearchaeia archaeon]